MRRVSVISFLVLVLSASTAIAQSGGVAGTWDATLTSPQGTFNVQLNLKQDGEKVNGVIKGQRGETPVEGTLTGKDLKLKYTIKFQENDLPITLTGTLDGTTIKGSADYGGLAQGDFNAKRADETSTTPAKAPESGAPAKAPESGAPAKAPESGAPAKAPESGAPAKAPESGAPTKAPESGAPTKAPESGAPAKAPESGAPTKAPESSAPAADKPDITGAWAFQVETSAGSGTPTFTFKQDGEKLTGQYKGAFGEAPVTGSVKGNKVDFVIKVDIQGQQATITYTGTIEKDGTMKGTAEVAEVGSATWTAKRQ